MHIDRGVSSSIAERDLKTDPRWTLTIAAVLLCASVWFCKPLVYGPCPSPAFHNLMFDSHERLHYIVRLSELHDALVQGQWMVRWAPNLEGGYGYPFFTFYAPLAYYLADVWHLAGADLFWSWKLHFLLMAFVSAVAAYCYARLFAGRLASLLAAMMYLFAPYHISDLYVRGNVAEFTAMSIIPFVFLFYHRLAAGERCRAALAGSVVSLCALILTHNISALFTTGVLAVYVSTILISRPSRESLRTVLLAMLSAALLCAWFWVPAIIEMKYTQSGPLNQTFRETSQHLVYWSQYFVTNWGFGLSLPGSRDEMSFALGWPQWAFLAFSVVCVFSLQSKHVRKAWTGLAAGLIALLLLMSVWASPLWKLPGFAQIQFPWRMLSLASLFVAVAGATGLGPFTRTKRRTAALVCAGFLGSLFLYSGPMLRVIGYYPNPPWIYEPRNTRSQFLNTNIGEFRPVWVDSPATQLSARRVLGAKGLQVARAAPSKVSDLRFPFQSKTAQPLVYEIYYFPGWKASADGTSIDVHPSAPGGLIELETDPARTNYRIWLGWSCARTAGAAASGVGLIIFGLLLLRISHRSDTSDPSDPSDTSDRPDRASRLPG